jgi:hypothetical protein
MLLQIPRNQKGSRQERLSGGGLIRPGFDNSKVPKVCPLKRIHKEIQELPFAFFESRL